MVNSLQISKVNSVVIFETPEDMTDHFQTLQDLVNHREISGVTISCRKCNSTDVSVDVCIIREIFNLLLSGTQIGCVNPIAWIQNRKDKQELIELVQMLSELNTTAQLNNFLARYDRIIKKQIDRFVNFGQKEFSLFVVSDFQVVHTEEQPIVAGILHKLVKGTPTYFRILSVGNPILFKKDYLEETGIQLNHDYIELRL